MLPEVAPPVEKLAPMQEVALVEDHDNIALCPWATVPGEIERVAVGGVGTVTLVEAYEVQLP